LKKAIINNLIRFVGAKMQVDVTQPMERSLEKNSEYFNTRCMASKWDLSSYERRKLNESFRTGEGPPFKDKSKNVETYKKIERELHDWINLFKNNKWPSGRSEERPIFNMRALTEGCNLGYSQYRYLIATVKAKAVFLLEREDRDKIAEKLNELIQVAKRIVVQ
jgi:hypothetical protein